MSDIKIEVLVVDDKKFMRDTIVSYISNNTNTTVNGIDFDFNITEVDNGEEAVLLYAKDKHEIVVMDLVMDNMDGLTATKEILEMNPNAKIIGMASEGDPQVEEFKTSGIKYFLEKPFQDTYINSKIDIMVKEIFNEKSLDSLDVKKKKKPLWKKIFMK